MPCAVLPEEGLERHAFWLFPVRVADPNALGELLRGEGFDTSAGHSLAVVEGSKEEADSGARELLEHLLFLPAYGALPRAELDRLARLVLDAERGPRDCAN